MKYDYDYIEINSTYSSETSQKSAGLRNKLKEDSCNTWNRLWLLCKNNFFKYQYEMDN